MISKPIVLTGLMGAGKTVTGQRLAKELNIPFCDTDDLITDKEKMSVSDIFESKGEPYFRQCETDCLYAQNWKSSFVMATGGGLFITPVNQEYLLKNAFVICLRVPFTLLKKRIILEIARRPLLQGEDWVQKLIKLAEARAPSYEKAHWCYDVDGAPVETVVQTVVDRVRQDDGLE